METEPMDSDARPPYIDASISLMDTTASPIDAPPVDPKSTLVDASSLFPSMTSAGGTSSGMGASSAFPSMTSAGGYSSDIDDASVFPSMTSAGASTTVVPPITQKRSRNSISIKRKMEILEMFDKGKSFREISENTSLSTRTLRDIKKRRANITETASRISVGMADQIKIGRNETIERMEALLHVWIVNQRERNIPLNLNTIKAKALTLFESVATERNTLGLHTFVASSGWFQKFKKRCSLNNVRLQGESASADHSVVPDFKQEFQNVIDEGDFSPKQIFNCDETALFWKRMPTRSYITKEEQSASGFKAHKDRLTLLLCSNAYGDAKLKPLLVYRSLNPRCFKKIDKESLSVHWRSNKKAWITQVLFLEWFKDIFIPYIEVYCRENNLDCKALLVLDNAPGHPQTLADVDSRVKVVFLPKNTTSLLQPLDQGIISSFKAYYLRRTLNYLVTAISGGVESVSSYWKTYDIKKAIDAISLSWQEVCQSTLNGSWKNLWPACVISPDGNYSSFEEECVQDSIEISRTLGFEGIAVTDITELLESHNEELSNEELLQLENFSYTEELRERGIEKTPAKCDGKNAYLTCCKSADKLKDDISKIELDPDRLASFNSIIDGAMLYYKNKFDKV